MKHGIQYPDDKFLALRPCLIAICMGFHAAAKLLGVLLYKYSLQANENTEEAHDFRLYRKQAQLIEDMYGDITEKTLHDVAIPALQLLGYIDVEERLTGNCYIVHLDAVKAALALYVPGNKEQPQLEKFLIAHLQLEKFLIADIQLEDFLIDKRFFLFGLEKVLIQNRKISNCQRGRKVNPEAASECVSRKVQNLLEDIKKKREEESNCDDALAHRSDPSFASAQKPESENTHALPVAVLDSDAPVVDSRSTPVQHKVSIEQDFDGEGDNAPTLYRLPAVRPTSTIPVTQAQGDDDAPAFRDLANGAAAPGDLGAGQPVLPDRSAELLRAALSDGERARSAVTNPVDTLPSGRAVPLKRPDVAASTPSGTSGSTQSAPAMPPVLGLDANRNTSPPHPDKRETNPVLPVVKGKHTSRSKPPKEEPPLLCETAKVRRAITDFRGFALEVAGEIINENKGIKQWCQEHSEDELEYVMERLPSDAFWGQADKRQFFRVQHFVNKASALLAKRVVREAAKSDVPTFLRPDGSISDYAAYALWKAHHPEPLEYYLPASGQAMGV